MAFLGQQYAPVNEAPKNEFDPLPSGLYTAMIVDSDMKSTKKGDGQYLELTYQILEGPFAERNLWVRLNLDNPNAKAVEIAQRDLAKIQFACGGIAVSDSQQLHNIPHQIKVEHVPAGPKRDRAGNEVKEFNRLPNAVAAAAAPPFAPQAQQPAAPAAAPGWAQRPAA
jgi:hypothetical protein